MKKILLSLMLALTLTLSGCGTIAQVANEMATDDSVRQSLAFKYATMKVLDGQEERANALRGWIQEARTHIEVTDEVSVAFLTEELRARIPWEKFDDADRMMVDAVILEAQYRLEAELGEGSLLEQEQVQLLTVLSWIEEATWTLS